MCFTEKCLFCVPLDLGSLLIGVSTFILSLIMTVLSIIILVIEENNPTEGSNYIHTVVHLDLQPSSVKILVTIIAITELFLMMFSVLLMIGVKKSKPNFVLSYFSYGVFIMILCSLSGILLMITGHWAMSIIKFIVAMVFAHFLVVVYSTYDRMLQDKLSSYFDQQFETDQEFLVETSN